MDKYILIYDSGMGGLSVLIECIKLLPKYSFLYFSDSKNAPYGNKTKKQIVSIATKNIAMLKSKFDIPIVVLACNTMTTTAIDVLRQKFSDTNFVGTEPCIKLVKDLGFERALVVCTRATAKNSKVIKEYKTAKDIIAGDKNLASLIEKERNSLYRLFPYVSKNYAKMSGNIDCVVLGCTHYVFVKNIFERIFNIPVFDSGRFVARRVGTLAKGHKLTVDGEIVFCDSGDDRQFFRYFNKIALYQRTKYVMIKM